MIPEKVRRILDEHGLQALEFEDGSTPTAQKAAEKIGVATGQIAKSMLLRGKDGRHRLFILAGDRRISSKKVKRLTGVKHSMSGAEETREVTGFSPGGVCPFGLDGLEIYLDRSLKGYTTIYPAAGNDSTGVPIDYLELMRLVGARECDVSD